ncbi:MAG: efflux RND transporter periplasmic adaptor subunit [Vicinamibacterales bacterium]
MNRKKILIGLGIVLLGAAVVYFNVAFKKAEGPEVTVEAVEKRDLEAIVSASGKIQAKRTVNITSEVSGKVVKLAVNEGDSVKAGQFLLQVDPRNVRSRLQVSEAGLAQSRIALQQARIQLENARVNLKQAEDDLRRKTDLWEDKLITRQELENAQNSVALRQGELRNAEQAVANAEQRIKSQSADLESAQHDLSRVNITSPIDGIVTRRNVEEGETAVVGFTNNPSVVLLVISDMSVIEGEIEVDETDIPEVKLGQPAKVTIDAFPDRTFKAHVTEVGNSPIQASAASATRAATNFKVVVTLDEEVPGVRPGFTCTADITTATRTQAVSVPIQALTVRELVFDKDGKVVREPQDERRRRPASVAAKVSAQELPDGQTRKETEGVFVVRDGKALFVPVKTGIAGDKYFEVLSGLEVGDRVITGPFGSMRDLADGRPVRVQEEPAAAKKK